MSVIIKAGRELDAIVAENVMGFAAKNFPMNGGWFYIGHWECKTIGGIEIPGPGGHPMDAYWEMNSKPLPHYSTDIAAAWQVVEKLDLFRGTALLGANSGHDRGWQIVEECQDLGDIIAEAETAPLVICLAALKIAEERKQPPPVADNMVHRPCGKKPDRCSQCMEYVCRSCYPVHDCAYSCPICHQKACGHSNEPKL